MPEPASSEDARPFTGERLHPEDSLPFTGERLHADDALFGIDLLRHRAAYHEAIRRARMTDASRVLELGSGTGYGTAEVASALAETSGEAARVVGLDRVAPLRSARQSSARFLRGDLDDPPLFAARFDLALSFQVVEHLEDPTSWLDALADHLAPGGQALVTTPNACFSDGENPFHVKEYTAGELEALLRRRFGEIEMLGVSARGEALAYHEARLDRIRRIVRIDPLGLRRRLPRTLVDFLFARLAILVRRGIGAEASLPQVDLDDFPIEPVHDRSLDLFAVCRAPRPRT